MTERNVKFYFKNNGIINDRNGSLSRFGPSIFVTTLQPCNYSCLQPSASNKIFSSCIGNFTFDSEDRNEISTSGSRTKLVKNETVWAVPGKLFNLEIMTLNDLSKCQPFIIIISILSNSKITLDSTFMSSKSIKFYGQPGEEVDVVLESVLTRKIVYKFHVQLQECPSGFVHQDTKCVCPSTKKYPSIQSCDNKTFTARLHQSYWMGYYNASSDDDFGEEKNLLYALCPFSNCLSQNVRRNGTLILNTLPEDTSVSTLNDLICGKYQYGILCSQCRNNYSLMYNDYTFKCQEVSNCNWGWLLYIAMEIIPVTVFFILVMVFDIQFTDGAVSGFILFVQISDTMLIKANGIIWFPQNSAYIGLQTYKFLSRIFNLNFFAIDNSKPFSFCLWGNASMLDLHAFKYVTILYALTLVVVIIAIFKYHSRRVNKILAKIKVKTVISTKSTIIHGISGFLVICYSECVRISFLLLTPALLFYSEKHYRRVVLYNGELPYFRGKHLMYALPALVIVIILGILPPLTLISYPLCYRVLALFKIGESRFSKLLCTIIPLEKFRPFFDSFQSSFKDEYRFFSGLYFMYRFTTLATYAFSTIQAYYYLFVQAEFAVIFTIHAVCQPYKKRWHNILDTLLFLNQLSLINLLTLLNFHYTLSTPNEDVVSIASTLQVILLYLPLAYMMVIPLQGLLQLAE